MKYLFGPVNSRRLGISLGVDLLPFKTCSLNCVYCECGKTTCLTAQPQEFFPAGDVIAELDGYLKQDPELDYITFAGSGEPLLYSAIGEISGFIKSRYPRYRSALLTNGTLLWMPGMIDAVSGFDLIVPSIDAVSEEVFARILRPADGVNPRSHAEGLRELGRRFKGVINIEVFIVPGENDGDEELLLIRNLCSQVRHDKIQINSLDRPGAEPGVKPVTAEELERIRGFFEGFNVELIGKPVKQNPQGRELGDLNSRIVSVLRRRPCTAEDLCRSLGASPEAVEQGLRFLSREKLVKKETMPRGIFYSVNEGQAVR